MTVGGLRRAVWAGVAVLAVLHAADLVSTRVGIGRGVLVEANPLAGMVAVSWWAAAVKAAGLTLLAVFALRNSHRVSAVLLVWCGVGWYCAVVVSNTLIAGSAT